MILIQAFLILFILFIVFKLINKLKNNQIKITAFLGWLVFWILSLVIIIYPESSSYFARILGVGRGVDLIIYLAIILLFYFIFYITIRLRVIEQQITEIVRKISLMKPVNKQSDNDK
ncbi:DUF2304 domain-containing protein [Patescibacteria group bacterium]|nr:DUF2304 domain-containing protein [Patescibacteria group bacterium]